MKEFIHSLPLALFLMLLCTLSISVYFGNLTTINNNVENMDTSPSSTPNQFVNDIKTILDYIQKTNSKSTNSSKENEEEDEEEDYEDWEYYWNIVANDPSVLSSQDYVPKTRIIPNICKQCNKYHNGVCANHRSLGGIGYYNYKNRFSDFIAAHGSGYRGQGSWVGYGGRDPNDPTLSKLAEETGSGLVDVTKTALNNATGLAAGVGLGAIGLAENVGSGATDLLRDTGSGATSLLRDTGSGAVGLVKDLGSGVKDVLKSNPVQLNQQGANASSASNTNTNTANNPYQSGYYTQGTYNLPNNPLGIQGIDPYSYNGALISKGSNFMPVTSDFSSFRK